TRRVFLHLSYSYAAPCGPALLVTQDPTATLVGRSNTPAGRHAPAPSRCGKLTARCLVLSLGGASKRRRSRAGGEPPKRNVERQQHQSGKCAKAVRSRSPLNQRGRACKISQPDVNMEGRCDEQLQP